MGARVVKSITARLKNPAALVERQLSRQFRVAGDKITYISANLSCPIYASPSPDRL